MSVSAPLSNLQEDVRAEAEGAAEAVRQAAEETEGAEGWRQVHQAGGKDTSAGLPASAEKSKSLDMCLLDLCVPVIDVGVAAVLVQEKQTKEALTRKQQKGKKKGLAEEESHEAPELLKRPREYTVKFTFPNPPPLSPPILGLHCKTCTALGAHTCCLVPTAVPLTASPRFSQASTLATTVRSSSSGTWTLASTWSPEVSLLLALELVLFI